MPLMAGRQAFLEILHAAGVEYIIGNPGTTELPLMDVMVDHSEFKYILTLQEGVAMAMADGYALASGKLGVLNVQVAPGLGNAMGMLYDAAKTAAPLLVTAGQQDGRYALTEPLLWGDMVRMVESMTKWAYQIERVADLPHALRRAIKVATTPPTGPVFLGLPMDIMMAEADLDISAPSRIAPRLRGDLEAMQRAADLLAKAQHPLILVGDEVAKKLPVDVALLGDPKATLAEFLPLLRARLDSAKQQEARQRIELFRRAKAEALQRLAERAAEEALRQPMSPLVMNKTIADSVPADIVVVDESITSGAGLREFLPRRHARDYFGL